MTSESKQDWQHSKSLALSGEAPADLTSVSHLLKVQTALITENIRLQQLVRLLQTQLNSKRRRRKRREKRNNRN